MVTLVNIDAVRALLETYTKHERFLSFDHNRFGALRYCFKNLKEETKNITDVFSKAQQQALSRIAEQTEQRKAREITLAKEHFVEFMSDILTTNPSAVKTSL